MPAIQPGSPRLVAAMTLKLITRDRSLHDQHHWITWNYQLGLPPVRHLLDKPALCGTRACIAGWAALLNAPGDAVIDDCPLRIFYPDGSSIEVREAGRIALGRSHDDACWLFDQYRTHEQVIAALETIAAGQPMSRHGGTVPQDEPGRGPAGRQIVIKRTLVTQRPDPAVYYSGRGPEHHDHPAVSL